MELKEVLAISKLPGLYQIVASRDNGLIVTPLGEDKRKFVASRQHMFTPLENITVYTNTDSIELSEIFKKMKEGKVEMPDPKKDDKTIRKYFTELMPDHDQQRVYVSDIKKMMKWFVALDAVGVFKEEKKKASKKPAKKVAEKEEGEKKSTAKKATKKAPKKTEKKDKK